MTYTLVVDRQSALQLVGTHFKNLQALVKINIGVVMFVENR